MCSCVPFTRCCRTYVPHRHNKVEYVKRKRLRTDTGLPCKERNQSGTTRSELNRASMICLWSLIRVQGAMDKHLIYIWVRERSWRSGENITQENRYCSRFPLYFGTAPRTLSRETALKCHSPWSISMISECTVILLHQRLQTGYDVQQRHQSLWLSVLWV